MSASVGDVCPCARSSPASAPAPGSVRGAWEAGGGGVGGETPAFPLPAPLAEPCVALARGPSVRVAGSGYLEQSWSNARVPD